MDPDEFDVMHAAEDRYWWYTGMGQVSRTILTRFYPPTPRLRILDAGCGTGAAKATYLAEFGRVTGMDLSRYALMWSAQRSPADLLQASVVNLPFPAERFDLIASFDVLSDLGVADDQAALQEFYRALVPGGRVMLRLPAFAWLHGRHDRAVATARRYTASQVRQSLDRAGFVVEYLTYVNFFLFSAIAVKRLAEPLKSVRASRSDLQIKCDPLNSFFQAVLFLEARLLKSVRFPWGVTVLAVGRK